MKTDIIAEIGGNFSNFAEAKKLIDELVDMGINKIKIQTFKAKTHVSKNAQFEMENTGVVLQLDLLQQHEISEELHKVIFTYANEKKITLFSTPSHETDVELLEYLGNPIYKIGSDDAVNIPFIKYLAKLGKPIILSTGMCTMAEVEESVAAIRGAGNNQITLLHCVTRYPSYPEDCNLLAMVAMKNKFPDLKVGYSDHTIGIQVSLAAVAMGAEVIERHFTLDKKGDGPDHMLSLDPDEMKQLKKHIEDIELAFGDGEKKPGSGEAKQLINNRKSIVINCDIKKDDILTKEMLVIKRPGYGIRPKDLDIIIGKSVNKDLFTDDVLMYEDIV